MTATYKYTYISESGSIWGVPLTDGGVVTLDVGPAVNIGGGIVGLPYNNASDDGEMRFIEGDVVNIKGTTNYEGSQTLTAGTTITQLQFTDTYGAETFGGTETVSKLIGSLTAGAGHMVQDSSGNLYYGHGWYATGGTYVTKIQTDGTLVYDFLIAPDWPIGGLTTGTCVGLAITPDDLYLYVLIKYDGITDYGYVHKFDLTTGTLIWVTTAVYGLTSWPGYDLAIDADGNAYAPFSNGEIQRIDNDDASVTSLTLMGQGKYPAFINGGLAYAVLVDDDLGIVIGGGQQYTFTSYGEPEISSLYNLAVRTFDDSAGDQVSVGGNYESGTLTYTYLIGTGMVAVHEGYIYVFIGTTSQIYKYQWDGTNLNEIANAAGPTYGAGLYFDLYGNLVVVGVDWSTSTTERFYFYDTDLNALGSSDPFSTSMLRTWDAATGGSWIQGDAVFNGALKIPEIPDNYWQVYDSAGSEVLLTYLIGEEVAILADGVVMPNQIVDDNGRIDCSGFPNVKKLHWGLAYESKLKPMKPVSQPDMMKAVVTCKQMGISVHNTDDIKYGVHDDDMHDINFDDPEWKNKCEIDGLFTGTVAVSVPDGFSVNCPLQITTSAPLPCTVRAMIPKVD